ncbi:hypothetical protein P12x_001876 [Tundrisphaera lichenicola]|uniref:hypothetical protein n=1 Tax=Tundrisphaera lichenicola TaxID=2029860 RepID=UPI003EBFCACB
MWFMALAKDLFILFCIGSLLSVGLIVTLRSGLISVGNDRRWEFWRNASRLVMALAGCLAFLLMIQQIAGIRLGSAW